MSDFPGVAILPPVLSSFHRWCGGAQAQGVSTAINAIAGFGWGAANQAVYVPMSLPGPYLVKFVWWGNGNAVAGNVDCGVLTPGGALMFSCGSTAQAGTSVIQSVTLGTAVWLDAGQYYLSLSASSTTAKFGGLNGAQPRTFNVAGLLQAATQVPLATSPTFATASTCTCPLFGIGNAPAI